MEARAEDLNNLHFGVVGSAIKWFSPEFMLRKAGEAEMGKRKDDFKAGKVASPLVPANWRPVQGKVITIFGARDVLGPPYGDNPVDHEWIKQGFQWWWSGRFH